MACSSNQSVSSSRMTWKYDVFVSFRGEDTRNNFTDHLFGAFQRKGIVAFKDDTNIKKGEHISSELQKAIEGSQILIVIFSRNYASSTWCLRELAKIAECNVLGQAVLPIFYDVSPSEVRKQSGDFEKAFREHEFKENLEEVQRWREALTQVANLSGCDVKDKQQYAEIKEIVKDVTSLLGHKFSTLSDDIVGMHSQVEKLEKLMMLDSDDDVRVVGISGMGGIGKTTLGKALYARISNQFEGCSYIDDVSKTYGGHGPTEVQKQLLCQTLKEENLQIWNHCTASNLIRTRLSQIKSLVILDNVDQAEQLDKLAMKREWLGTGSRMIVISRDHHNLREHEVDEVYEVQLLDHSNALQLFCRKAFKSDDILTGYTDLTNDVLKYANGLPLAIEVLGSFLYGRDVSKWRSALERLRENPMAGIMNVLRISFDGLLAPEKDIFLDIACFFYGESETYVTKVLDFRGFHPEIGLSVLHDKSFITCEEGNICMHDLFRELGKSIVREKSPKEPRKWNRLWDYKDLNKVMSENMETENLEAIVLQPHPYKFDKIDEIQAISTLRADSLAQMNRLKLLMLWGLNFSGSLNFLSSELGYLCWDMYPFTYLPSSFEPDKLVELILPYSNIRQLWEGTKPLHNLTRLDLSHSKNLIMMPSFLEIPNLEFLDLEGCIKLAQIDPSIGTLRRLFTLNLKNCTNLVSIPNKIFGLTSLQSLNLSGCPNFWLGGQRKIEHLEMLENNETTTQYQPTSFIYQVLKSPFRFFNFQKSRDPIGLLLPSVSRLSCLQHLDLSFCNLPQIPTAIGCLHCLETLNLRGNNFVTLPSFKELFKLRELNLEHCKQLKYLPELPSKTVFPVEGRYYEVVLNMFGCPSLTDIECCYGMVLSWMIQLLQVPMKSDLPIVQIKIVIPRMQMPMWFNKQYVGSSISMEPLPNMDDKNFIGVAVACCITLVGHDDLTSLDYDMSYSSIQFCIKRRVGGGGCSHIEIHHGKDLVTVDLQHLCLIFITREELIYYSHWIAEGLHDIIDLEVSVCHPRLYGPHGLLLKVKNCGYRWIFQEDLEQLNSEMYSTND